MTSKLDNAIERLGCSTVISKEALNDGSSKHGLNTKLIDLNALMRKIKINFKSCLQDISGFVWQKIVGY